MGESNKLQFCCVQLCVWWVMHTSRHSKLISACTLHLSRRMGWAKLPIGASATWADPLPSVPSLLPLWDPLLSVPTLLPLWDPIESVSTLLPPWDPYHQCLALWVISKAGKAEPFIFPACSPNPGLPDVWPWQCDDFWLWIVTPFIGTGWNTSNWTVQWFRERCHSSSKVAGMMDNTWDNGWENLLNM